jgi:hypothetical protein
MLNLMLVVSLTLATVVAGVPVLYQASGFLGLM